MTANHAGDFVDYIVSGLDFTDISLQLAVTYVCIQLYKQPNQMDKRITQSLVCTVLQNIQGTSNNDLLVNLLGINLNSIGSLRLAVTYE